jgi:hypothetical protein
VKGKKKRKKLHGFFTQKKIFFIVELNSLRGGCASFLLLQYIPVPVRHLVTTGTGNSTNVGHKFFFNNFILQSVVPALPWAYWKSIRMRNPDFCSNNMPQLKPTILNETNLNVTMMDKWIIIYRYRYLTVNQNPLNIRNGIDAHL